MYADGSLRVAVWVSRAIIINGIILHYEIPTRKKENQQCFFFFSLLIAGGLVVLFWYLIQSFFELYLLGFTHLVCMHEVTCTRPFSGNATEVNVQVHWPSLHRNCNLLMQIEFITTWGQIIPVSCVDYVGTTVVSLLCAADFLLDPVHVGLKSHGDLMKGRTRGLDSVVLNEV